MKFSIKRITFYTIAFAVTAAGFSSCKKFLDVVPNELVTDKQIWGNINNANAALAHLYSQLPNTIGADGNTLNETTAATDECFHHWGAGYWPLKYNTGAWNSADNPFGEWELQYRNIRKANLFLENIDKVPIPTDQVSYYAVKVPHYKAEARFMRALFHFQLFKMYGAVPVITNSLQITDKGSVTVPRNSVDEVVAFIVNECEAIAPELLPKHPDADLGRANRGAALALAARTLLYAASPLFNGNAMYANVKNLDGKQLFNQSYDKEKWKKAADAAQRVMDLDYIISRGIANDPINSYGQIFYTRNWTEIIMPRMVPNTKNLDLELFPFGGPWGGWGKYSPFQELIDAYETKTGYPIDHASSGYVKEGFWSGWFWAGAGATEWVWLDNISNMYKDRDPRFYATITYQGSKFNATRTNNTPIRLAWWGGNNGASQAWPKSSGTFTVSGYNVRKWCDPKVDPTNWWTSPDAQRNDPLFRVTEFYLAYAEAMNEYNEGPTPEAYAAVNAVRARVDMPGLPIIPEDITREGFRKRVQNEKRVEFAFEGHRFWDVRRWLIAKQVDNGVMHGMNARPTTAELQGTGLDVNSEAAGLAVFYKEAPVQTRVFLDRHYLMPIPQREMDVNDNMVQNYGW
ncbi:RagB/SusD family nutrient uptake outer membrane protein [Chitinophaga horti]|uniref:RagB/SusD family nutrient uptake outer membrane protein n=1 Tax=Chitinophaga horti TaxID=2920382 RepID=A0ABY6IW46_9BACT|nr:RagB/SusD family nutrient uptake outer membrane protein [Chitinophaga horti]UYQ91468.1 RagB/SusD family nutrient uptake outer membrane protein [Chitinophaga horti]